ncbi:hypothetical protein F9C07_2054151 [Aspergillus flavus]|uniref:Ysc84 actin-binding domain-containing protein n=1 Tax=Aspergillus flavus (strain ATCC 200026 / FGSC A1120 / IAM 13836 / NRRL 3357 / JCM 12722 / SRRC 167) TaxID=332952 RepID=A0A7U2QRD2_ASPFN|nr:hypothetical protein F9C07_2054151 [Aspergillus flavus]
MSPTQESATPVVQGRLIGHFHDRPLEEHGSGWSSLWDSNESDLWDRGKPSPALIDLIEQEKDAAIFRPLKPDVTPGNASFVEGDFFKPGWERQISANGDIKFDLVYDYTFLCALHPQMRPQWAARMSEVVAPDGVLVCLEFPMYKDPTQPGPPWGLNGVHWDLLARGGDGIKNIGEEAEVEEVDQLPGRFRRLQYHKPARSYDAGRGADMLNESEAKMIYGWLWPVFPSGNPRDYSVAARVIVNMPRGLHNPLPASLRIDIAAGECKKATQILESFLTAPYFGNPGKELPGKVLVNAKGLAICTVAKAGFLGSARFGSGLVIARLDDGSWSAPSAISLTGAGFGGQVGFELTDFVFILDDAGLRSFLRMGSLTLGANISIAFGPVGRNAEFTSNATMEGISTMYAYSKTKGLFGGISIEGGLMVERRHANKKLYKSKVSASQLLGGEIPPPLDATPLLQLLQSSSFQQRGAIPHSQPTTREPTTRGLNPVPQGPELPTGPENQSPAELSPEEVQPTARHFPAELHGESSLSLPSELPAETIINIPDEPTATPVSAEERPQTRTPASTGVESKPHGTSTPETAPLEIRSEPTTDTPAELKRPIVVEPEVRAPSQTV